MNEYSVRNAKRMDNEEKKIKKANNSFLKFDFI